MGNIDRREFIGKTLTRDAAANERVNQKAFELVGKQIVQAATTARTIDIDISTSGENLIKTIGDPLATEVMVGTSKTKYRDALLRKMTKEEADIRVEETFREGKIEAFDNQASLFPEETIEKMTAKKKVIAKMAEKKKVIAKMAAKKKVIAKMTKKKVKAMKNLAS